VGLSLLEREVVHARMDRTVGNPTAKAAIDRAVWDVLGRTPGRFEGRPGTMGTMTEPVMRTTSGRDRPSYAATEVVEGDQTRGRQM
jgi:hypothetical protein